MCCCDRDLQSTIIILKDDHLETGTELATKHWTGSSLTYRESQSDCSYQVSTVWSPSYMAFGYQWYLQCMYSDVHTFSIFFVSKY